MSGVFLFCLLFAYASASISASPLAEFIAVAGGGAGAQDSIIQNNAGGGAGGYVNGTISIPTDGIPIQIIVGAGGRGSYANNDGFNGEDSSFGDAVAKGGGGAGGGNREGRNGGSGGGGGVFELSSASSDMLFPPPDILFNISLINLSSSIPSLFPFLFSSMRANIAFIESGGLEYITDAYPPCCTPGGVLSLPIF